MANSDRDKDDVRVFDGGEDGDEAEGSHLPVVMIIAILVLAAFGGVVWLAYNQGVARGRSDVPVRVAAAEPASSGSQIKVYQQQAGAEDEETTAPAKPQAAEPATEAPAAPKPEAKPVAVAAPPEAKPVQAAVAQPEAKPAPPPVAAKPKPATPVATKQQAPSATPVAQAAPVAQAPPVQLGLAHPAPEAAKPVAAPQAAAKPAAAPKPAAAAVAGGSYLLQIGAYKSEDEALGAWKTYRAKHGALLAGFTPDVQRADLGGKGVWYRLRIAAFADKDAATALCDKLKAENGTCFLAR